MPKKQQISIFEISFYYIVTNIHTNQGKMAIKEKNMLRASVILAKIFIPSYLKS